MTLQAVPLRDRELTKADLDRSVEIMARVDRLGVAEPEIRTQGDDQISIQLPGVDDPAAAANIIGKTAQLELFDLEKDFVAPSIDARRGSRSRRRSSTTSSRPAARGARRSGVVLRLPGEGEEAVRGPVGTREAALAKWDGKLPKATSSSPCRPTPWSSSAAAAKWFQASASSTRRRTPTTSSRYTPPEVPEMTGVDLNLDGTRQDFDTTTGEPIVLMDFTDKGAETFERITRDVAQRGRLLFNTVGGGQATPRTTCGTSRSCSTARSSRGRRSTSSSTWRDLGLERRADLGPRRRRRGELTWRSSSRRALPVEFRTLDQTAISATLGKDSLEEAKLPRSSASSPSRSSCSSSTASSGSSRSSA